MAKQWIMDDFSDEKEIGYFFHLNDNAVAHITLRKDGTVVFASDNHWVEIKSIGSKGEKVSKTTCTTSAALSRHG